MTNVNTLMRPANAGMATTLQDLSKAAGMPPAQVNEAPSLDLPARQPDGDGQD